MKVEAPERIWIESEGECPYFYHEEELSDVAPPITEYVRADKLEELAAEREALRETLATLKPGAKEDANALANARLIAAAPELLAALENVMANPTTFSFEPIRAAIAKATGNDDAALECTCAAKDMTFG